MTDRQHENILMSAIMPSVLAFFAACFTVLFIIIGGVHSEFFMLFLVCILGILGFVGLVKLFNNKLETKIAQNFIFLTCGFLSYSLIIYNIQLTWQDILAAFNSLFGFLFLSSFVWVLFVYFFYLVLISKKLLQKI